MVTYSEGKKGLFWIYFAQKGLFLVMSYGPNYTMKAPTRKRFIDSSNYQYSSKAIALKLSCGSTKTVHKLSHIHCSILFMQTLKLHTQIDNNN